MKIDKKYINRFWERVDKSNNCWLWKGCTKKNYGVYNIKQYNIFYAHRFSWLIHFGDPGLSLVCHQCDTPQCVNPQHLFLGSHQDNMNDKMIKGRHKSPKGEHAFHAKLTDNQAQQILSDPRKYKEIAEQYKISTSTISHIKHGKTFKEIYKNNTVVLREWGKKGEDNKQHKLTELDVINIRHDIRPNRVIGRDYGVSDTLIRFIKQRKVWRHL